MEEGVPVEFGSRKMSPRKQYLLAYESKLLAIVHALTKWKQLIGNRPVTVENGHATLGRMLTQKRVITKLRYSIDKLAGFNLEFVYEPGRNDAVADAITRRQDIICALHGRTKRTRRTPPRQDQTEGISTGDARILSELFDFRKSLRSTAAPKRNAEFSGKGGNLSQRSGRLNVGTQVPALVT